MSTPQIHLLTNPLLQHLSSRIYSKLNIPTYKVMTNWIITNKNKFSVSHFLQSHPHQPNSQNCQTQWADAVCIWRICGNVIIIQNESKWYDSSILLNHVQSVTCSRHQSSVSRVHQSPEVLQHLEAQKLILPSKSTIYIVRFLGVRWEVAICITSIPWGSHKLTTMSLLRKLDDDWRKH